MKFIRLKSFSQSEVLLVILLLLISSLSACNTESQGAGIKLNSPEIQKVSNGDPIRGRQLLYDYGCGACHTIPGVTDADAMVGPPLESWAERAYIAGSLANTPENLIYWIRFPQEVEPGTAMPDTGASEQDARDMSAYL